MADITKAEPDSPTRCQCTNKQGQCRNESAPHSNFCLAHGGNKGQESHDAKNLRNYRRGKWIQAIHGHADASGLKNLCEEIGILRVIMQERLDSCNNAVELICQSQQIADLVMKIEHVVMSCHKLDDKLKRVVDRSQLLQFASETIDIIASVIDDESILTTISDKILTAIGKLGEEDAS